MCENLIFVIDESGTTNYPHNGIGSDFSVGGIVCTREEAKQLVDASKRICETLRNSDYKFRQIQKSAEARTEFVEAIGKLKSPSGVYGFYAQGGSLLAERQRSQTAFTETGIRPHSGFESDLELIRQGDRRRILESFFEYFAGCVYPYAGVKKCKIKVVMDRRTDLRGLPQVCGSLAPAFANHPAFGDVSGSVVFEDAPERDLSHVVRLAGVVAGDVCHFFRSHATLIQEKISDETFVLANDDIPNLVPAESERFTLAATIDGEIGDEDFLSGSKSTGMIRGYSNQFLSGNISFALSNGILGYLYIPSNSEWQIHRIPDETIEQTESSEP